MQAIRKIINLENLRRVIDIPKDFNYSKVEILILPVEDESREAEVGFDPEEFYGVSHIKNVEGAIQEMRNEWDRL
ncbi:MAG: hypothetical protein HQM14_04920 [SAR324 cluster bacterium]|nr:hypothetical protein [SAR324 cluster bacterium]